MDTNLVEMWLRKDPVRWMAGVAAGLFAALVMIAFSMLVAILFGMEAWYPVKIAALPFFGSEAGELGFQLGHILVGVVFLEVLGAFLGFLYAHFNFTNQLPALLAMGVVWGIFAWIFISNLFIQSSRPVFHAHYSSGAAFFSWIVFGISLTSVAFFDRMLRGSTPLQQPQRI